MVRSPDGPAPHLVALEQCGLELQAPHLRTTTKRRIETTDVDVASLPSDSLRFTGWDPEAIVAVFPGLHPDATYEVEATWLCERDIERVQRMTSGAMELQPPIELTRGTATIVRAPVPQAAYVDGTLEIRVERVRGPDAVMSELRLFSSVPPAPTLTVVGDSRGDLLGSVATPDSAGVPDAVVRVTGDAGTFEVTADGGGLFRVPLAERLPRGRDGSLTLATGTGARSAQVTVDTRQIARGLRELPPASERLDLAGEWAYHGGPFDGSQPAPAGSGTARVPGHIVYDSLVPDGGMGTFRRRRGPRQRRPRRRPRERRDLVRRRPDAVPAGRRQRARGHPHRVHAAVRARQHELVRPHVAPRHLARLLPVHDAARSARAAGP
jgi:hypothetical protein